MAKAGYSLTKNEKKKLLDTGLSYSEEVDGKKIITNSPMDVDGVYNRPIQDNPNLRDKTEKTEIINEPNKSAPNYADYPDDIKTEKQENNIREANLLKDTEKAVNSDRVLNKTYEEKRPWEKDNMLLLAALHGAGTLTGYWAGGYEGAAAASGAGQKAIEGELKNRRQDQLLKEKSRIDKAKKDEQRDFDMFKMMFGRDTKEGLLDKKQGFGKYKLGYDRDTKEGLLDKKQNFDSYRMRYGRETQEGLLDKKQGFTSTENEKKFNRNKSILDIKQEQKLDQMGRSQLYKTKNMEEKFNQDLKKLGITYSNKRELEGLKEIYYKNRSDRKFDRDKELLNLKQKFIGEQKGLDRIQKSKAAANKIGPLVEMINPKTGQRLKMTRKEAYDASRNGWQGYESQMVTTPEGYKLKVPSAKALTTQKQGQTIYTNPKNNETFTSSPAAQALIDKSIKDVKTDPIIKKYLDANLAATQAKRIISQIDSGDKSPDNYIAFYTAVNMMIRGSGDTRINESDKASFSSPVQVGETIKELFNKFKSGKMPKTIKNMNSLVKVLERGSRDIYNKRIPQIADKYSKQSPRVPRFVFRQLFNNELLKEPEIFAKERKQEEDKAKLQQERLKNYKGTEYYLNKKDNFIYKWDGNTGDYRQWRKSTK